MYLILTIDWLQEQLLRRNNRTLINENFRKWRINEKMDNTKFLFLNKKLLNKNIETYDKAVMPKMWVLNNQYSIEGRG